MTDNSNIAGVGHVLLFDGDGEGECGRLSDPLARGGYTVSRAGDADSAIELINEAGRGGNRVEAVVACTRADDTVAVDLLERLSRQVPDAAGILIADVQQIPSFASLLNRGVIERLLLRPCDGVEAFDIVDTVVRRRRELREHAACHRHIGHLESKLRTLITDLHDRAAELTGDAGAMIYYDELTALASRALLEDRLNHAIKAGRRDTKKVVLLLLGLDRFKYVNEGFGREAGDRVLVEIARRIAGCVRSSDTVGRYGGDVFGLVVTGSERTEDPGIMAQRVLDAVAYPLKVRDQHVVLTASVGIGLYPDDGKEPLDLIESAEAAMRQAKLEQGNQFRFYSTEFNRIAGRRLSLESELRRAIEKREFTLCYQPRIDTVTKLVVGAEALLRWAHPQRGILPPGEFLPVLEETGLIEPVGQWVLEQAAQVLVRWRNAGLPRLMLAVNLSARQFHQKSLTKLIAGIADNTGLDLSERVLELEITESLLMEDIVTTRRTLNRLHEMGLRIAIDDFGTGYSALSYLIKFSLDYLKIDKSFVDRLGESEDAKAIVEAIISLSYSLRLTVIAEGVETRDQFTALQALGCKQFQGYLFARPMPEKDFMDLVSRDGGASIATLAPVDRLLQDPIPEPRRKFN